ncbi:myosin-2 heavy chain [Selaginella moellendorffii]|uniref:myosin-2 heavy chain n=1 Tax=Selaginella moellendorffii TaxID=88036 RepID=UPI000D1C9873|nr:myosin-2 heavy chain [Selaginella moellendorffii]|eukprot:XP_024517047.1 myosin-2 heavy chain [Selaginella moellendorffii]
MRKQTLDLAQQAQVAACLYLGFDPHEIKYNQHVWQKNLEAQYSRPLELHLHHHHHHYMDKPGSRNLADIDKSSKKSEALLDAPKAEFFVEENSCHQEMILRRDMESLAYADTNYNTGTLGYVPPSRGNPVLLQEWDVNSGTETDYGSHYYMSSSKTERVATSVKRKKHSSEQQNPTIGSRPDWSCESRVDTCSRSDYDEPSIPEHNFRNSPSPTCRINHEQLGAGQFVMRRSIPRAELAISRMNVRENNLFVEDNARLEHLPQALEAQPRVHSVNLNEEETKKETLRLQQLLAHEKMKGDAYRNQLLSVQKKYRALSEEMQEEKHETPRSTTKEEKNHVHDRPETPSGDDTPRSCDSRKSSGKAFENVSKGSESLESKTVMEGRSNDAENDLNDLLRNFSKLLDKKLKEEMFVKVTKAIESVLDNGCSTEQSGNKTGLVNKPEVRKPTPETKNDLAFQSCGYERPASCDDQPEQKSKRNNSSCAPNGYSNVYLSPVYEEQRHYSDHDRYRTSSSHKDADKDYSLEKPDHRNLEKSFVAGEQGDICSFLAISFFYTVSNQEKQDATNRHNAGNEFKVSELSEEVKAKEKALHHAEEVNQQLASEMSKTETALSLLRLHCTDLKTSLEAEVEESKGDIQLLEKTIMQLKEDLTKSVCKGATLAEDLKKSESKVAVLEDAVSGKDSEVQEVKKKMCGIQKEADEALLEKYELVKRVHEFKRDANDQKQRIDELVGINDELLVFAQGKEAEVASNSAQIKALQEENGRLAAAVTQATEKLKEKDDLNLESDPLRTKLADTEYELSRLSSQLSSTIEIQDKNAEEAEQLRAKLRTSELEAAKKDDEIHQLRVVVHDLRIKLTKMEAQEIEDDLRLLEGLDTKAGRGTKSCDDVFSMLQSSGDMRWKVQQLEEEILEKDGQIAILRSSFPEEYDSIF